MHRARKVHSVCMRPTIGWTAKQLVQGKRLLERVFPGAYVWHEPKVKPLPRSKAPKGRNYDEKKGVS